MQCNGGNRREVSKRDMELTDYKRKSTARQELLRPVSRFKLGGGFRRRFTPKFDPTPTPDQEDRGRQDPLETVTDNIYLSERRSSSNPARYLSLRRWPRRASRFKCGTYLLAQLFCGPRVREGTRRVVAGVEGILRPSKSPCEGPAGFPASSL